MLSKPPSPQTPPVNVNIFEHKNKFVSRYLGLQDAKCQFSQSGRTCEMRVYRKSNITMSSYFEKMQHFQILATEIQHWQIFLPPCLTRHFLDLFENFELCNVPGSYPDQQHNIQVRYWESLRWGRGQKEWPGSYWAEISLSRIRGTHTTHTSICTVCYAVSHWQRAGQELPGQLKPTLQD